MTGATITRDLIVQDDAGGEFTDTTVGRDIVFGDYAGALILRSHIGHDIVAGGIDSGADIFESTVGHDFVARGEESGFDLNLSTVGHDMLLLGLGGGTHMGASTIGHDFFASRPQTVQTGHNAPDTPGGPVNIGHDFTIEGSPDLPFVFDGICDLNVGRDLSMTDRTVNLGIGARQPVRGNGAAGEHDRTRPDRDGEHRRVRLLRAVVASGSATTTSVATSCSATTRPFPAAPSRFRGTPWAVTRPARRTTPPSRSARRTSQGARTPAASDFHSTRASNWWPPLL